MKGRLSLFILLTVVVSACSGGEVDTGTATTSEASLVETAPGVIYGRNDDGTFFHGAPDAPVTFIDYSDFL